HKFEIVGKIDALVNDINAGDNLIIDASLLGKEYEHNGETRLSTKIWASKVYAISKKQAVVASEQDKSTGIFKDDDVSDVPF
ncbi:hypothetical protein KY314_02880, partial [Candidatus Woesearchaeota archaeon]|nr:hypothetical protein [Candidatus Woesearchaeota archaeon]